MGIPLLFNIVIVILRTTLQNYFKSKNLQNAKNLAKKEKKNLCNKIKDCLDISNCFSDQQIN